MHLVPTQQEVVDLLRSTGALRDGHFEVVNGLHTDKYLDVALTLRCYRHQKTLSVALSRLLREQADIRAIVPELSIVAVTTAALPIAWGLCEALRAKQVYWAERESPRSPMQFRQFLEQIPGEKVVLVDDVLRAGSILKEVRTVIEARGAEVLAAAAIVLQPMPGTVRCDLPVFSLARVNTYYAEPAACELCRQGLPLERQESVTSAIGAL